MARITPDAEELSEIYIDETSQTKHRYLIIGGLIIHARFRDKLEAILQAARMPELPAMELGWTKVSNAKLDAYRRFIDVFFDNAEKCAPLEHHLLVVDTHRLNHKIHNCGSREVGFNKEVYQLCDKFARLYRDRLFHVHLDSRTTNSDPEELRLILNRGRAKKSDPRDWPFRRIHFRHSHQWQCLQLVDLLIGGIAYTINGHDKKEGASPAKTALSKHILDRAGIADPMRDTAISGKFTIWHRQLK
jgi:hypothetical protein